MSRFVNAALIGLVSFLFLFSSQWYLAERTSAATVDFVRMESRWAAVDGQNSELRSRIMFHNAHQTLIELVRIEHEVLANGDRIDWDHRNVSIRMTPQGDGFAEVSARFPNTFLLPWLASHARDGEATEFVVRGMATFNVLQSRVIVPYDWKDTFTTGLGAAAAEAARTCGDTPEHACLGGAAATWVAPRGSVALNLRADLRNPRETPVTLRDWAIELRLHGHVVARSDFDPGTIEIPGLSSRAVETLLRFDTAGLGAWWPQHVGACEQSPLTLTVRYLREETASSAENRSLVASEALVLDGRSLTTRFACVRT